MAWAGRLPVLTSDRKLLQMVCPDRAQEMVEEGRAFAVGTKTRTRAVIMINGSEEFLRARKPPRNRPDTHQHETEDNPRGVWTFQKRYRSVVTLD